MHMTTHTKQQQHYPHTTQTRMGLLEGSIPFCGLKELKEAQAVAEAPGKPAKTNSADTQPRRAARSDAAHGVDDQRHSLGAHKYTRQVTACVAEDREKSWLTGQTGPTRQDPRLRRTAPPCFRLALGGNGHAVLHA